MKRMNFYILGAALVLLILLTATCACCDFKPHSNKVRFSKYEGMEGDMEGDIEGDVEGDVEGDMEGEVEGGDEGDLEENVDEGFGHPYEGMDEMEPEEEEMEGMNEIEQEEEDEEDVEEESMATKIKNGFGLFSKEGMQNPKMSDPRPYSEDELYDIYGPPTKGSLNCGARSAGLSNSKGPLCLSDKQLNLLKTRGGNASNDAQIGA